MARVLRDSRGRYNGSTKGWGRQAGTPASAKARKQVIRHTARQANKAGLRGAGRRVLTGAKAGVKAGIGPGVVLAVVAGSSGRQAGFSPGKIAARSAGAFAGTLALSTAGGAAKSRPIQGYRASAQASAKLGMANRKVSIDSKVGLTRKESLSSTYRTYNKAGSLGRRLRG